MRIKTILTAIAITLFVAVSCTKEIESRLNDLESRVSALEQIAEASKNGDIITYVTTITENSELIGYHIEFQKADPINIYLGKDGDSMFQSVTVTDTEVTFITSDGQTLMIRRASVLSIEFDSSDLVVMGMNDTRDIHYTITSGEEDDITIEALSSTDIKVKVVKSDAKTGMLNVKTGPTIDEYSKVVVLVSNGSQTIMRTLNFEEEAIEVEENASKEISDEGGEVELEYFSNVLCQVLIPDNASNWISVIYETKSLEKHTVTLKIEPNTKGTRSTNVVLCDQNNSFEITYFIEQKGEKHYMEREALIAIYNELGGDRWLNNRNWCTDRAVGEWYGITTDADGYVISIELDANNLSGIVPNVFDVFGRIKRVAFNANGSSGLQGPLPESLLKLYIKGTYINITHNYSLTGDLPQFVFDSDIWQKDWYHFIEGTQLNVSKGIPLPEFSESDYLGNTISSQEIYSNYDLLIIVPWPNDEGFEGLDELDYLIPIYNSLKNQSKVFVLGILYDNSSNEVSDKNKYPWPCCIPQSSSSLNDWKWYISVVDCKQRSVLYTSLLYYSSPIRYLTNVIGAKLHNDVSLELCTLNDNQIMYVTNTGKYIDGDNLPNNRLISNYVDASGVGNLTYEYPIEAIPAGFFKKDSNLQAIKLPDSIQIIGSEAFRGCYSLEEVYLGQSLKMLGNSAFSECYNLRRVHIPSCERIYSMAFAECGQLEEVCLPDNLKEIQGASFLNCSNLLTIRIPDSIETINDGAFIGCTGIISFSGKYATDDGLGLIINSNKGNYYYQYALGSVNDNYSLPDSVTGISSYAFANSQNLKQIIIPNSVESIAASAFEGSSIESVLLPNNLRSLGEQSFYGSCLKTIQLPRSIETIGSRCFMECLDLEEIVIKGFIAMLPSLSFCDCLHLKSVVLPPSLLFVAEDAFDNCPKMEKLYLKSKIPPIINDNSLASTINNSCIIYVPQQQVDLYKNRWKNLSQYVQGYDYSESDIDLGDWVPGFYVSMDYSNDGVSTVLSQSSVGAGIDLVFMGDGFSDRQIADGTYGAVMQNAGNAFFSEEPFKSMKDRFNVYSVNVVSATEGYKHSGQTLSTGHGDGSYVYGNDAKVIEYAKNAIGEERMDDAVIIVMMNEDDYAGTCYMFNPQSGDYGRGLSIAYFPISSDANAFYGLVSHEAGGHGFAKLADEYVYPGTSPSEYDIAGYSRDHQYGWWMNLDFTDNIDEILWSRFIKDARYANDGVGIYEGALFEFGAYRPSENSIMRYNTGGFNAPSRYAIWYRIGKLAYGESWEGSYEDFVAYDAVNRTPAAVQRRSAQRRNYVEKPLPQLPPPVVVGHSWREDLQKK